MKHEAAAATTITWSPSADSSDPVSDCFGWVVCPIGNIGSASDLTQTVFKVASGLGGVGPHCAYNPATKCVTSDATSSNGFGPEGEPEPNQARSPGRSGGPSWR